MNYSEKLKMVAVMWMKTSVKGNVSYLKGRAFLEDGESMIVRQADGSEKHVTEFLVFESQSQKAKEKSKWYLKVKFAEDEESKDSQ